MFRLLLVKHKRGLSIINDTLVHLAELSGASGGPSCLKPLTTDVASAEGPAWCGSNNHSDDGGN